VVGERQGARVPANGPRGDPTVRRGERCRRFEADRFKRHAAAGSCASGVCRYVAHTGADVEQRGVPGELIPEWPEGTEDRAGAAEKPVGNGDIAQGSPGKARIGVWRVQRLGAATARW
jgi:hypothetical protein